MAVRRFFYAVKELRLKVIIEHMIAGFVRFFGIQGNEQLTAYCHHSGGNKAKINIEPVISNTHYIIKGVLKDFRGFILLASKTSHRFACDT